MDRKIILIGAVVLVILGVGAFLLFGQNQVTEPLVTPQVQQDEKSTGLGAELSVENPDVEVPDANVFQDAETNPFDGANTNPFQNTFNPFE